jgi:hypothetical protein
MSPEAEAPSSIRALIHRAGDDMLATMPSYQYPTSMQHSFKRNFCFQSDDHRRRRVDRRHDCRRGLAASHLGRLVSGSLGYATNRRFTKRSEKCRSAGYSERRDSRTAPLLKMELRPQPQMRARSLRQAVTYPRRLSPSKRKRILDSIASILHGKRIERSRRVSSATIPNAQPRRTRRSRASESPDRSNPTDKSDLAQESTTR